MKSCFIVFVSIVILYPVNTFGQKYLTKHIMFVADSILKSKIGDSLFTYAKYDSNTYYEYKSLFGKQKWEALRKSKRTKGRFVNVDFRWDMKFPSLNCVALDTFKCYTSITLDSLLHFKNDFALDFIPDFILQKQNCNMISKEQAIVIIKENNAKKGLERIEGRLEYDRTGKAFTWVIDNYLTETKGYHDHPSGEVEIFELDAYSGAIKNHRVISYCPLVCVGYIKKKFHFFNPKKK